MWFSYDLSRPSNNTAKEKFNSISDSNNPTESARFKSKSFNLNNTKDETSNIGPNANEWLPTSDVIATNFITVTNCDVLNSDEKNSSFPLKNDNVFKIVAAVPSEDSKDTPSSWVSAWCCALVSFLVMGLTRCNGLLFVHLMAVGEVTRGQAAWPFNVSGAAVVFIAPLTGYLSGKYSVRCLALAGSFLFAFGTASCYFNINLIYLSVFFGLVRGSGMIITTTLIPILIHRHFTRYRTTAMGLATAGGPVGSIVFPPVVHILLEEYGLQGTFLLIGAIALHTVVGSISIRKPATSSKDTKIVPTRHNEELSKPIPIAKVSLQVLEEYSKSSVIYKSQEKSETLKDIENKNEDVIRENAAGITSKHVEQISGNVCVRILDNLKEMLCCCTVKNSLVKHSTFQVEEDKKIKSIQRASIPHATNGSTTLTKKLLHIMTSRGYYLIALQQVLNIYLAGTYYLVIVDYVRDKGRINPSHVIFMLTTYAVGEITGKLGLGWITDREVLRRQSYLAFCILTSSAVLAMLVWSSSYVALMCCAAVLGVTQGTTQAVTNVLYAEYLCKDDIPMAISCTRAVNGAASLARSLVIGFFRDSLGSYDLLFVFLSGLFLFSSILWFIESFIQCFHHKRAKE